MKVRSAMLGFLVLGVVGVVEGQQHATIKDSVYVQEIPINQREDKNLQRLGDVLVEMGAGELEIRPSLGILVTAKWKDGRTFKLTDFNAGRTSFACVSGVGSAERLCREIEQRYLGKGR